MTSSRHIQKLAAQIASKPTFRAKEHMLLFARHEQLLDFEGGDFLKPTSPFVYDFWQVAET